MAPHLSARLRPNPSWRVLLGVAIIVGLVAVCSPAGATAQSSDRLSSGFIEARIERARVSLQFPRDWLVFAQRPGQLAAQRERLARTDPARAAAFDVEAQTALLPTTSFEASDLGSAVARGVSSSVNVQVVDGGFPSSLENFRAAREPNVESAGGRVLRADAVDVRGRTAYRIDVELPVIRSDGTQTSVRLGQLLLRHGAGRVVVTAGAPDDDAGASLVEHILTSVRPLR